MEEGRHSLRTASEPLEIRNLARGRSYEWSEEPEEAQPDPNNRKLTDGTYGSLQVSDPAWVGHVRKKTREVLFDLGEPKSIVAIKAHFLQDWPAASVLFPLYVSMYVSDDRLHWAALAHQSTKHLWTAGPPAGQYYTWKGTEDGVPFGGDGAAMVYARYVKVAFPMHTWARTLIDEIEIWGFDGKAEGAVTPPPQPTAYLQPGEATAGIRNLSLVYNGYYADGAGNWTKEQLLPEISYVNERGEVQDWLFDGVLLLGLRTPDGRDFGMGEATLRDWIWYLDKTFAEEGDLFQLNEAVKEAGHQLREAEAAMKVVLMIPDPGESVAEFGDVDGDGRSESLNAADGQEQALANRKLAVRWWIDEVLRRWQEKKYSHLELVGLYWLNEQIDPSETAEELIRYANRIVHDKGLKAFWIPHFLAFKVHRWKEAGFDAVAFQPNYFFEEMDAARMEDAAALARQHGMGVEIEFDSRVLEPGGLFRSRLLAYLDGGVQYGYMKHAFKAYYKGSGPVLKRMAESPDPETRRLYDLLYKFVRGTYA